MSIAGQFCAQGNISSIDVLGSGNVNDTFLVALSGTEPQSFVLQRLNTHVFDRPDLVMKNMLNLIEHVERKLASSPSELTGRRWEIPRAVSYTHLTLPTKA